MKKILIILFISFSSVAFGQKHLVGIQGGLNFTNFTSKNGFENTGMRTGFIGGFSYDRKLSNRYRIGLDALYAQQGVTDKFMLTNDYGVLIGEIETKMNYDYLCMPIKIGYEIGNKAKVIPKIGIVPAISINAESTSPTFDGNGKVIGHETVSHNDYISKFDLGGVIEIGIEEELSKNIILCSNLNYKHSFTTFSNSNYFKGSNMRHYGFSIALGIKFRLSE